MTLLTIVECASDIIGVPRPTAVITSTDQTVRTMFALLNREGQNLAKLRNTWGGGWTVLEKEHTFTTTATIDEYAFPADFGEITFDTVWDRTNFFEMRGSLSPQQWQIARSGLVASPALRLRYRIKRTAGSGADRKFFIDPVPTTTGDTLVFEYLTKQWVADTSETTFRTKFEADDDIGLLDEDLLEMGLVWRFKQAKGFGFAAEVAEYEVERDRRIGNDPGATKIFIARRRFRLPPANVPQTGFGT